MLVMIRTRDFAAFGAAFVFLSFAIGATWLTQSWTGSGQTASVIDFSDANTPPVVMEGAIVEDVPEIPRESNINRLRGKIAAGEGDISAGEPVFTSVDDVVATSSVVSDGSPSTSVLIGSTMSGDSLMSDDLWRFIGFSHLEQIGVALDNVPIYGAHPNPSMLDTCGGVDEGLGYRYHLMIDKELPGGCYGIN